MDKRKRRGIFTLSALALTVSLCVGCADTKSVLWEDRVSAASASTDALLSAEDQIPYFSEGLCVIPEDEQTAREDAVMTAKASLLINDTEGEMLYSHNIYKKIYPASITKIVTALVALKYGDLSDTVTVSYEASHITEYGAKLCGFSEGDQMTLDTLLSSFLIYSGNDAGVAIAEHIAGSVKKFAKLMNREAKALGAVHSHFVNPHGLHDKKHYTTAYDLYLIFHALVQDQTFLDIISQSSYTAEFLDADGNEKSLAFTSTDRYLIDTTIAPDGVTVIGGKTGTTYKAGSCLILYTQGESGDYYISVVLKADGADSLYTQMNNLLGKIT